MSRKTEKPSDVNNFSKAVDEKLNDPTVNYDNVFQPSTALCKFVLFSLSLISRKACFYDIKESNEPRKSFLFYCKVKLGIAPQYYCTLLYHAFERSGASYLRKNKHG